MAAELLKIRVGCRPEPGVPASRDFGRPGRPRAPDAARAKAVSRSACHRTPILFVSGSRLMLSLGC